jgi:hypothetical protein
MEVAVVRGVGALLLAIALLAPAAGSAALAEVSPCDQGDARAMIESGPVGAGQFVTGLETERAENWERCQFRLYQSSHTFSVRDWMVGGVFFWQVYDALDRPDYDRQDAIAGLDQVEVRVLLGPVGGKLEPVPVTRMGYKDFLFLDEFGGHVVYTHFYLLIQPGQLPPGQYRWRYEAGVADERPFVSQGLLTVLP